MEVRNREWKIDLPQPRRAAARLKNFLHESAPSWARFYVLPSVLCFLLERGFSFDAFSGTLPLMSFTTRRIRGEAHPRAAGAASGAKRLGAGLLTCLTFGRPVLLYYQDWKKRRDAEKKQTKAVSLLKRVLLILLAVLLGLVLLSGVAKALFALRVVTVPGLMNVAGAELPADANGFTNILLLGEGDAAHDGKDLTDTIIVASIDPKGTKSAVLLSLPRDLYFLKTEKMGKGRINSLYRDYKGYLRAKGLDEKEASL